MQRVSWPKQRWAKESMRFLQDTTMKQTEHTDFLAKRRWLQNLVGSYKPVCAADSQVQLGRPQVLIYGSSVAGTAFEHGDVDFALVFPRNGNESRAVEGDRSKTYEIPKDMLSTIGGFGVINREVQPEVLSSMHDHIKGEHPDMNFQRIFRARIPIMQFVPSLSELQKLNAESGRLGTTDGENEETQQSKLLSSDDDTLTPLQKKAKRILLQVREGGDENAKASGEGGSFSGHIKKKEHFDISLSLDGCRNSLLLRKYMEANPKLRAATMVLKHWGRKSRVLNARRGWLSPYSLTVMLIHYAHSSGLVKELVSPATADEELSKVAELLLASQQPFNEPFDPVTAENDPLMKAACFSTALPLSAEENTVEDISEILEGFFHYYSETFDFDTDVVDIRTADEGRVVTKDQWSEGELKDVSEKERWHRCGYEVIMIRDPYENHSLGRSVEFFRAESIREEFRKMLMNPPTPEDFLVKL